MKSDSASSFFFANRRNFPATTAVRVHFVFLEKGKIALGVSLPSIDDDVIAASIGGMMHITGPRDGAPCKSGTALTDLATGLYAKGAILTALLHRTKTVIF